MIPHALKPSPRRRPGPQECATHLPTVMPDLIRDPASSSSRAEGSGTPGQGGGDEGSGVTKRKARGARPLRAMFP